MIWEIINHIIELITTTHKPVTLPPSFYVDRALIDDKISDLDYIETCIELEMLEHQQKLDSIEAELNHLKKINLWLEEYIKLQESVKRPL